MDAPIHLAMERLRKYRLHSRPQCTLLIYTPWHGRGKSPPMPRPCITVGAHTKIYLFCLGYLGYPLFVENESLGGNIVKIESVSKIKQTNKWFQKIMFLPFCVQVRGWYLILRMCNFKEIEVAFYKWCQLCLWVSIGFTCKSRSLIASNLLASPSRPWS